MISNSASPESLAEAIEKLLADEPNRSARGAAARLAVEQRFTAETMASGFLREIESLRGNLVAA